MDMFSSWWQRGTQQPLPVKHFYALFCVLMNSFTLWQVLCAVTDARAPVAGYAVANEWPGLAHNPIVCHDLFL